MYKKIIGLLIALSFTLVLAGCMTNSDLLNEVGILGKKQLVKSSEGFYYVSVKKNKNSSSVLRFKWFQKEDKMITTELKRTMILIQIDNSQEIPVANFQFDQGYLNTEIDTEYDQGDDTSSLERYNPNNFIMGFGNFTGVVVRISKSDLMKETYLMN